MTETAKYQHNFSEILPEAMFDVCTRKKKAQTMLDLLHDQLGPDLSQLKLLDLGCSAGIIADCMADYFQAVLGIDIDRPAVAFARRTFNKPGLLFCLGDSMDIGVSDGLLDVVICAQVYEHVPDPERMMREIFRVLKPGGICCFAAGNRLTWTEPHYGLPLLSVIPRFLGHLYMKASGRGDHYHERFLTYWSLRRLVKCFKVTDYTEKIIESPGRYHASYMIRDDSGKQLAAKVILKFAYWLSPGYIWVLKKPFGSRSS